MKLNESLFVSGFSKEGCIFLYVLLSTYVYTFSYGICQLGDEIMFLKCILALSDMESQEPI